MTEAHKDRDFIEFVVKNIVDNPDEVEIERNIDDLGVLVTLKVAKEDMGKIIGKGGQTAKAMRILLRLIGSRTENRVNLKILEPDGAEVELPNAGLDEDLGV
ncbi:KH domain-containing protein [bacterium]|jgi:uncharacterized protein|nr:KH domain-containing protein [bacterium]MBT6293222.1 KH domain-containing protein [bacterium]